MKAFRRLDHLLCDVPNLEEAYELFHNKLGFPEAWPIGRYWPSGRTCGIALGGANLELVQSDEFKSLEATIRRVAFEPTSDCKAVLERESISYRTFEKRESDQELLRLRGMKLGEGEQLLCTNILPDELDLEFPFFACDYASDVKARLAPDAFQIPGDNALKEVWIGVPEPELLSAQIEKLGIVQGVPIKTQGQTQREVTMLVMKNGPIDLGDFPARFRFVGSHR
jgi:hypothetical protein